MDNEIQDIVDEYIDLLGHVHVNTQNIDATIAILQEVAKDRRVRRYELSQQTVERTVTPKQLQLLEKLKVDCDPRISVREASQLIDDAMKNRRDDN